MAGGLVSGAWTIVGRRRRILDLKEQVSSAWPQEALTEGEAVEIAGDRLARVSVEWPSPANGRRWVLRPAGWVGSLPIGSRLVLRIAPKIEVARLFELLDRVNDSAVFRTFEGDAVSDEADAFCDTVLGMLERGVAERLGRGLHRGYRAQTDEGQAPRGRVLFGPTLRRFGSGRPRFVYATNPISEDVDENRILAWTLCVATTLPVQSRELERRVRALARRLASSVALVPCDAAACRGRDYGRRIRDYARLHALCAMVLDAASPAAGRGNRDSVPFGVWMPGLFEKAVVGRLAAGLRPATTIEAGYVHRLGGGSNHRFVVDAVVRAEGGRPLAVVDTKYKFGSAIDEQEIQQVVAYATAVGARIGILIYASDPGLASPLRAGNVTVWPIHFDLDRPFETAAESLDTRIGTILRDAEDDVRGTLPLPIRDLAPPDRSRPKPTVRLRALRFSHRLRPIRSNLKIDPEDMHE